MAEQQKDSAQQYIDKLDAAVSEGRVGDRGQILEKPAEAKATEAKAETPAPAPAPAEKAAAVEAPKSGEKDKPAAEKPAEAAAPAATEPEPTGVQAKDGKHVIPHSVLKETRERLTAASEENEALRQAHQQSEERTSALETQLADLRGQLDKVAAKTGQTRDTAKAAADPENPLAGLNPDDYPPELVKAITGLVDQVKDLRSKVDDFGTREDSRTAGEADARRGMVQTLIDQNEELASWQSGNPEAWAAAKRHDAALRDNPTWADRPMAERFTRAVQLTRLELDLPEAKPKDDAQQKPKADAKAAPPTKPLDPPKPAAPSSLSHIPGGAAPATTEGEALMQMDGLKGAAMLAKMTPKQMDEFLVKQFGG